MVDKHVSALRPYHRPRLAGLLLFSAILALVLIVSHM